MAESHPIFSFSLCPPGLLASNYGLEAMAFMATKPELEKKSWPDMQLHFSSFIHSNKELKMMGYDKQVGT
jgi:hypothetical protein